MQRIVLVREVYEPLQIQTHGGEIELVNDFDGAVYLNELTCGENAGDTVRIKLTGHNGTPPVYLGTEGSQTIIPGDAMQFPRRFPIDEVAVLTWSGIAWSLVWE